MPLSEEELRLLEQMERALVEEDPKLASTLRGTSWRLSARRRAIIAGVVFVLGVCILMTGAIANQWAVGIAGFVVMLGSAVVGINAIRGQQATAAEPHGARSAHGFMVHEGGRAGRASRPRRGGSGSFMGRMEERWRRRREENGGF